MPEGQKALWLVPLARLVARTWEGYRPGSGKGSSLVPGVKDKVTPAVNNPAIQTTWLSAGVGRRKNWPGLDTQMLGQKTQTGKSKGEGLGKSCRSPEAPGLGLQPEIKGIC